MLGGAQAALLGTASAGSTYTPFRFVTTDNPPVDHTGVENRPGYSPADPRSAAIIDPMSGLEIFRIGGDNGSPLFIDGTKDSGLKFPCRLRQDNNPRMQKVWNADSTLLVIERRFVVKGDAGDAGSYLIDVNGSHGASRPWGIIRASSKSGLGDKVGNVWALDRATGNSLWKQNILEYRQLTTPAVQGGYGVVGDLDGYLHWLKLDTGEIAGRDHVHGAALRGTPQVSADGVLYAVSNEGKLSAYRLGN